MGSSARRSSRSRSSAAARRATLLATVLAATLAVGCAASGAAPAGEDASAAPGAPSDPGQDADQDGSAVTPPDAPPAPEPADPAEVGADELGLVPVLMYHRVIPEPRSRWDITPEDLRAELVRLFDAGYRPVRAIDLARGELDVPAGTTPVVLTFDDSSRSQARLLEDGTFDPDSAVGILLDVASGYDDVEPVATFYVIGVEPFGEGEDGAAVLRALAAAGFELGNHTYDHPKLSSRSDEEVRRQLAGAVDVIRAAVPDAEIATFAPPYGVRARDVSLVASGSSDGTTYRNELQVLVGSEPTRSPFHVGFDPMAVPRIFTSPRWSGGQTDYGSLAWLTWLDEEPGRRYVSDGDPTRISFPRVRVDELAPEHRERANPY